MIAIMSPSRLSRRLSSRYWRSAFSSVIVTRVLAAANTLVTITEENALRQYRLLNRLLSLLGLMIAIMFSLIGYDIIQLAQGSAPISTDFVLIALPLTCSIILPVWYITRSVQLAS